MGRDLAVAQRAQQAGDDPPPVVEEDAEQHDRGGEVGRHEEGQEVVVVLVDVPAQQPRRITAWPRLETGKGSATPCRRPRTMAWR